MSLLLWLACFMPCWMTLAEVPVLSYVMSGSSEQPKQTALDLLSAEFRIPIQHDDKHIERWRKYYLAERYHLKIVVDNMLPFLPLIMKKIKEKGLPGEVAIIPMVESCYRINEGSSKGAMGLWQINGITAVEFRLVDQWNYDARLDVMETTEAALTYLKSLYQQFKSWHLVFAAYNVGPSRVKNALKKINFRYDQDFYKLDLPKETMNYVPKILALTQIIKYHEFYGLNIPEKVDELVAVECAYPIDFRDFMLAFNVPLDVLVKYNPNFNMYMIPKSQNTHTVLLPRSYLGVHLRTATDKLNYVNKKPLYTVKSGDSLTKIAQRFNLTAKQLMEHNQLRTTVIQPGQFLFIPPVSAKLNQYVTYTVKPGDSLYTIARQFGTNPHMIMRYNELTSSVIHAGQVLQVPKGKQ